MTFLNGLKGFAGISPELDEKWSVPENENDILRILESEGEVRVIYKHSYSCATSIFAKNRVEEIMRESGPGPVFHFIDVKRNRPLSGLVAEKTGVRHESPQILVVRNGEILWHASHGAIRQEELRKILKG